MSRHIVFQQDPALRALVTPRPLKYLLKTERYLRGKFLIEREVARLRARKYAILKAAPRRRLVTLADLDIPDATATWMRQTLRQSPEILIGDIGQDGFVLSHVGPIANLPVIAPERFVPRSRQPMQIVCADEIVAVRKSYRGRGRAFVNELTALHVLAQAGCNVPAIIDIDFDAMEITTALVLGAVLREELAHRGAIVRDRDLDPAAYAGLRESEKQILLMAEGRRRLGEVIDEAFVDAVFEQVARAHAAGCVLMDLNYANVVIEARTGAPWFIDFEWARCFANLRNPLFRYLRRRNLAKMRAQFTIDPEGASDPAWSPPQPQAVRNG